MATARFLVIDDIPQAKCDRAHEAISWRVVLPAGSAQRRPEWSSAPNSPSLDMTYLPSVSVPDTTRRSPWLSDPIREHCRRFWRINDLRQGMVDDVPCN